MLDFGSPTRKGFTLRDFFPNHRTYGAGSSREETYLQSSLLDGDLASSTGSLKGQIRLFNTPGGSEPRIYHILFPSDGKDNNNL